MRLHVVNPNTTQDVTAVISRSVRAIASDETEVTCLTAPFGVSYIGSRAESAVAAHAVLDVLASERDKFDAVIVAAFTDPGVPAIRELFDVPVLGMAEAAMLMALALGGRFSIVSVNPKLIPVFTEQVESLGLGARLAEVHAAEHAVLSLMRDSVRAMGILTTLISETHARTGANSVIIGGAPLAGQATALSRETGVTVLDGVACAVAMIESMYRLGVPASAAGIAPKESKGLSAELRGLFAAGGHQRQKNIRDAKGT